MEISGRSFSWGRRRTVLVNNKKGAEPMRMVTIYRVPLRENDRF